VAFLRRWAQHREPPTGVDRWTSTVDDELAGRKPAGYGARLPAPLARIGSLQLRTVDRFNEQRRRKARRWDRWAASESLEPAHVLPGSLPTFLRYPVMVGPEQKRDLGWGQRLGVKPGKWFLGTEHPTPGVPDGLPVAARAVAGCVNLPTLW
jgi:dTDP-4-amino-4,6-dideoxygalactose transaminase